MFMQKTVLMTVLSVLFFPTAIQAETTRELMERLQREAREAARNNPWVKPTDCPEAQAAVRQFPHCDDRTGNDREQSISAALEWPWVYRFSGKVTGQLMTANELRQAAESTFNRGEEDRRVHGMHCGAALTLLRACAYNVAATKREGAAPVSPAAAKEKLESQCAPDAVARANQELQKIDQRLADFLASPAGQQTGTITLSMQVVMWGTSEQAKIMKHYCPKADAFQERIDSLMSSFQSAQQGCRTIQRRPEICGPVAPP